MEDWQICVITRGEIGFGHTSGEARLFELSVAGVFYDAGKTLRDLSTSFGSNDDCLLIVSQILGGGIEDADTEASPAVQWTAMEAAAAKFGWMPTSAGYRARETGWLTWRHTGTDRKIHMGVLNLMDQDRTPLFKLDASVETIMKAVVAYHAATGALWRMTPGVSGCTGIRAFIKARKEATAPEGETAAEPHWRWDKAPEDVHGAGFPVWSREIAAAEKHGFVYSFDIKAQYLAAMAAARLGWGEPKHKAQPVFDPERAGYWQITAPPADPGIPWIIDARKVDKWGMTWVTTPVMIYLRQLGIEPLCYHSWTSATSAEFLKPWAHRLRNSLSAQAEICPPAALKRTYAEAVGMMAVQGGTIYRPDWRDTIVDLARCNMFRKIDKAHRVMGVWPLSIYHDAVHIPGSEADYPTIANALGVTPGQIGKFQQTDAQRAVDWLARKADKRHG